MPERVVIFGAGATGRGHIGLLCAQAGLEVVFVDRNPELVRALQDSGCYRVRVVGSRTQEFTVEPARIYHHLERSRIAQEILGAALVLTAVFPENLPDVAETIAISVKVCREGGRSQPINCIACENMADSSTALGSHTRRLLEGADCRYANAWFGFPDCMISRVVPRPEADPLFLITEDYNEWTTARELFLGPKPPGLDVLELVDNQPARLERKLMIHNGGHAVCGYLGFHRGHRYIHEAVADPMVAQAVGGALNEAGDVIQRRHGFSAESIEAYKQDLGRRGSIAEMRDEVLRVVRDPVRKLSRRERLVGPASLAVEYGLPRYWLVRGIAAALHYRHPADLPSMWLSEQLQEKGVMPVVTDVCGVPHDSPLASEIVKAYQEWEHDAPERART